MKNNLSIPQAIRTYQELLTAIRRTRKSSQSRIETAVEQEKVREAWETGKLIDEHVLFHKEKANYGEKVIFQLSKDLGINHTDLKYMLQFARAYPIGRPADQLSWSHYQSLLAINDLEERTVLAQKAKTEKWTRDQIREEIKKRKMLKGETLSNVGSRHAWTLQEIPLGTPGTYRIVPGLKRGELVIDLGFSTYYHLPKTSKQKLKAGDIVTISNDLIPPPESGICRGALSAKKLARFIRFAQERVHSSGGNADFAEGEQACHLNVGNNPGFEYSKN